MKKIILILLVFSFFVGNVFGDDGLTEAEINKHAESISKEYGISKEAAKKQFLDGLGKSSSTTGGKKGYISDDLQNQLDDAKNNPEFRNNGTTSSDKQKPTSQDNKIENGNTGNGTTNGQTTTGGGDAGETGTYTPDKTGPNYTLNKDTYNRSDYIEDEDRQANIRNNATDQDIKNIADRSNFSEDEIRDALKDGGKVGKISEAVEAEIKERKEREAAQGGEAPSGEEEPSTSGGGLSSDIQGKIIEGAGGEDVGELKSAFSWGKTELYTIVFVIAIGAFVFIGIRFVTARGNPEEFKKAWMHFIYAIIGLFLVFASLGLVKLVSTLTL